ncbi:MAG: hypothetical protein M3Y64_07510 [Gemmatimonadota bacterium]|nr:hypothetical protein [Gemmatimonadota bacterium]
MLVIAFDGILFDTLAARSRAVCDALADNIRSLDIERVRAIVAGQTISETVRLLAAESSCAGTSYTEFEETAVDIACLRAERAYASAVAHGVLFNPQARSLLLRAAAVTRIVVRADSGRREVEMMLQLAELSSVPAFVRCSDDNSSAREIAYNASSISRSYESIAARLAHQRGLLGECSAIGIALEASAASQSVARKCGFDIPPDLASVHFAGG